MRMLDPIKNDGIDIKYDHEYNIDITLDEKKKIKEKMVDAGIDFKKPVIAFAINSRRPEKIWNIEYMELLIKKVLEDKKAQAIFYYSPAEKKFALDMHKKLGLRTDVFTNVVTESIRELAVLLSECDMFIGNEGGPRHIAQGVDTPSVAIFSPSAEKKEWLSNANERHRGIEYLDILTKEEIEKIVVEDNSRKKLYDSVKAEDVMELINKVWEKAGYDKKYKI